MSEQLGTPHTTAALDVLLGCGAAVTAEQRALIEKAALADVKMAMRSLANRLLKESK